MYWDHMHGWGWTMMLGWSLLWIGFLSVLACAVVQWARREPRRLAPRQPRTPRELLDERFASGEIELDEYQSRREALDSPTQAACRSRDKLTGP